MPLLDDVAAYLEANSIGIVGVDIFAGKMPMSPDKAICLYELPGYGPHVILPMEQPGVKIRVRDVDSEVGIQAAMATAYSIKKLLHRKINLTLGSGVIYARIDATGNPGWVGQDNKGRSIIDVNFIMTKAEE